MLRPRLRRRDPGGHRERQDLHGPRLPPRPRPDRRAWHGRLRLGPLRREGRALHNSPGLRARGLHAACREDVRSLPEGTRRRSRTAARRPRAHLARSRRSVSCKEVEKFRCSSSRIRSRRKTSAGSARSAQQCSTPIAMGELFNSPHEWTPLISERLIDYIRIHVSQAGGLTPCRKIAALGEIVRRQDRLARTRRRLARRPRRQRRARPGLLQLRHPGILRLPRARARKSSPAARR